MTEQPPNPPPTTTTAIVTAPTSDTPTIAAFASEANFNGAQRMAKALAASQLMPAAYQNNLPNVLIAMELANRIGASVLMVAQNLDLIHGRPSWRASFLIACVNSSKRFTPMRFRFQGDEGSLSWGCRAVAKDRETGEECVGPLVTMKTAADEGWSKKNGSKWLTLPELMLTYRSAAFWARIYAPELSLGMSTTDEVMDMHGAYAAVGGELPAALVPQGAASLEAALDIQPRVVVDAPQEAVQKPAKGKPAAKVEREPGEDDGGWNS